MTEKSRCLWTGAEFKPFSIGGHDKKFATARARAEAHKAARQYTEHLIDQGFLTWEELHRWADRRNGSSPSNTTEQAGGSGLGVEQAA